MNAWIYLIIAGIFEMLWVLSLRFSENFTKIPFIILTAVFMIISLILLSLSFESIPMGTAYACWTAMGAVGVLVIGILFLGESADILRIFFILVVVAGIIGINLTSH